MFDSSRVAPETRVRAGAPDPSHRPSTALHKVEKKLWMGRDSLSLFSGPANAVKRGSDRRNDHIESGDFDAVQGNPDPVSYHDLAECATLDRQMRQVPTASSPSVSRPPSTFGDSDTATVAVCPSLLVISGQLSHPIATAFIQVRDVVFSLSAARTTHCTV